MNGGFERRLLIVWLALSGLTIASFWAGSADGQAAPRADAAITIGVIAMALVKVRIILREFMEVRHAPALLCRITDLWLLLAAVSLLGTYFVGMAATGSGG